MKFIKKSSVKYSVAIAVTLALSACGNSSNESKNAPSNQLAGGELAQTIADATAGTTNALNGAIPGSPIDFESDGGDDDVAPAPPSIGADIPVTYFGPSPTTVNRNLVGPLQLLTAGTLDLESVNAATVTLPLYQGVLRSDSGGGSDSDNSDREVWYIVTDTSDKDNAEALGLNFSAKLLFADIPASETESRMSSTVRSAYYNADGQLIFSGGSVDFSPVRNLGTPGNDASGTSNLISTVTPTPGAEGSDSDSDDGFYSPLVQISNAGNHVYNAPMVSFAASADELSPYCDGIDPSEEVAARAILHDSVSRICPGDDGEPGTVTINLVQGFSFGRPVLYLSTDASTPIAAALENAIHAPALANIPVGRDDSLFSPVERIFGFTNGPVNQIPEGETEIESNPQRQGFNSAIRDEGGPLNVLGGIPTIATDYSPLWDLNLGEWTQEAVDRGYRSRMTEEFAILGMVERGFLTGPGGTAYGSSGIIINCPIVHRLL
ncbi:hypothetical protein [Pelagibaculum spongiae]|uniref:Uncharacterized protein n=1 Tax=Pelagibaculum spongiae TaxID=2080658 RepID=A0A2V1H4F1_9GAMM|nr:hypothetical protein [Pelagibaculum spongiae]PVZ71655.1 hypothetical protein DC094_01075 [Pelagibaculum spongiae]